MAKPSGPILVVVRDRVLVQVLRCHGAEARLVAETIADALLRDRRTGKFKAWVTPGAREEFLEVRIEQEYGASRAFVLHAGPDQSVVDEVRKQVSLLRSDRDASKGPHPPTC